MDPQEAMVKKRLEPLQNRISAMEPSLGVRTRVLARFDEIHQKRQQNAWSRFGLPRLAWGLPLAALFVAFGFFLGRGAPQALAIGTPIAVSLAIQEMSKDDPVVRAQVDLPQGVHFYVPGGGEVAKQVAQMSSVELDIESSQIGQPIRLVVTGDRPGQHVIRIRFFNQKGEQVAETTQTLYFAEAAQNRGTG